jgi:hypothetical protein
MKQKSKHNKIAFNKASVVELNDYLITDINGGTLTISLSVAVISFLVSYTLKDNFNN